MELTVLEESDKRMVLELKGANHTLCNALKSELTGNKHVKAATYAMGHPLVGIPKMIVETDGNAKPRKLLADAAAKLSDTASSLKKEFRKVKA
jgi:DNA-directed RNA polymerase subunit L